MSKKMLKDLREFSKLSKDIIENQEKTKISNRFKPEELLERFDISLKDEGIEDPKLFNILKDITTNSPQTSSNLFFNQLFGGLDSKAVVGDLIAVLLNHTMSTYKIAGPMVAVEKEIIKKIAELISYPSTFGGTFPTGGSMSNFMAMIIARDNKDPNYRYIGKSSKLICYSSESSHYSIGKNASFSGIGRDNVRYIKTNEKSEMIINELQKNIEEDISNGHQPFFVNATLGTTVLGGIDPIKKISKLCKKYNLWLHIDGAYSGSTIFSNKYKSLIKGIESSDSFCFNAHKTLGTPLSTSILMVRNNKHLLNSFKNEAEYLYQTDPEYNLGQTSFECGRRNNSLKFWTLWKSIGTKGIEKMVNHNYLLANFALEYVKNNPNYTVYSHKDSLSICFNYKNIDPKILCDELYKNNTLLVGYGSHHGKTFVRLVSVNRENKKSDILNFFKTLEIFSETLD